MIHVITDGTTDMPQEWAENYGIHVIPLRVTFSDEIYTQGIDVDHTSFYQLVEEKGVIPQTSLPSLQHVINFYRSVAKVGDQVISIHVSAKLSGTYSIVEAAARELAGEIDVHPYDSAAGSAGIGFMAREAGILARAGCALEEIKSRLDQIRKQLTIIFTIDRLEFARKSGRVTVLQSTLASMLNIKPILVVNDGLLEMGERVRTRKAAIERVLSLVHQQVGSSKVHLAVVHANAFDAGRDMLAKARAVFDICDPILLPLSIPIAAHLGPGALGIVAYPAAEES